jgi:hypothetical protein
MSFQEQMPENPMNPIETTNLKKYRCSVYDHYDTNYAKKLRESFAYVNKDLQNKFIEFTDNLINDEQINRFSLLSAIDDFSKNENNKIDNNTNDTIGENTNPLDIHNYSWINFTDAAFNYRPYQPCCVM